MEEFRPATEALANAIADLVRRFYTQTPESTVPSGQPRVFCVLNALASNAGVVLAGTGPDSKAIEFFTNAVAHQIAGVINEDKEHGKTKH
jgi:hypothetical protein